METESSISDVDQERATSLTLSRFINFVKNAMKSAKLTTAAPPSDTKDDDKRGATNQEDTAYDDDPDISGLLNSPKDRSSESDRFSNLKLVLFPCEEYEYCGSGRKYQQNNNNQSLNEAAKSLEKFVLSNNREPGDRDRSFDDSDKACVSPGSLIHSGSEEDSAEDLCCPACHIKDCKLSFEEYLDFSDDTESEES